MSEYTSRTLKLFWQKVNKTNPNDCWEWQAGKDKDGYGKLTIDYQDLRAHRASWIIANGDIPDGLIVLHKCDNPSCVNPSHLTVGTQLDNAKDRDGKGRQNYAMGEGHPGHKLTTDLVKYIRSRFAQGGISQHELARQLGFPVQRINRVILRKCWRHIP